MSGVPDPKRKRTETPDRGDPTRPKVELILLSVFDGIGCAMLALEQLQEQFDLTVHFFAWETDQECIDVTTRRFQVRHG